MTKNLTNTQRPKYLPTNDVIFKCLLGNPGNERITKSFLEHITGEVDPWLEFFINPYGEEVQNMARTRAELEEAVRQLRLLNADEEVQQLADAEDWARYDYNSAMAEMEQKGLETGRAGERNELAKKMLEKKMDIDLISELTGLTKEEIESLL